MRWLPIEVLQMSSKIPSAAVAERVEANEASVLFRGDMKSRRRCIMIQVAGVVACS